MTDQEIFDKVATHLLTQGRQSLVDENIFGGCAYRGHDGTRCAVGCLISDEAYTPNIEGQGVYQYDVLAALAASGVIDVVDRRFDLLAQLQDIHDYSAPDNWAYELEGVAHTFGLSMP
jgi:hypothetical protein